MFRSTTLLVVMLVASVSSQGGGSEKRKAILIETHSTPRCYGLDCPPWAVTPELYFCFQEGDRYHTAIPRPWEVPWTNKAKRLLAMQGQSFEIVVTEKEIRVLAPQVDVRLKVVHNDEVFQLDACNHA
jgi:hypothetical protein